MGQREGRCSLGASPPPPAPDQVAEAEAPWVALSFDDGPSETCTPAILETLALWRATASFFVLGRHALRLDHLVRQAANQGHTLGCHSFSHRGLRPVWDIGALKGELELGRDALWRSAGVETDLYRAPYGRTTPWTRRWLRRQGWTLVEWNVSPRDWTRISPETLARRVLSRLRTGSIVLLHDGDPGTLRAQRKSTVLALPLILQEGQARGFRFIGLEEALAARLPGGVDPS